ncbi:MAG TPA: hypothetical protein VG711_10420, partial [Phycisphaerales bacterium]|nr:hypothetical protein [Phycisphaerales bacterium]
MRARFQTLLALIFAFVFTSSVFAQHEDPKNAAPYYTSAIENLPAFTDEQWALIIDIDPNKDFDPIRPILSRAFRSIDSAMRGSRLPYCDFDLDYSQGLELLLPHLGPLRNVARLMHAQALLQLHDNNPSAASATIAAMYRMANHLSADRTLISSLVAAAIFSLADSTSQAAFDRMLFSASDSATLYGAVSSIPAHDPFAFGEAIAMEQSTLVDEFDRHFTQDEIPADFLQSIQDPDTPPNPLITQIAEEGSFDQELQRYDEFMTKVVSAFTNPDDEQAAAQLAELEKSCAAGDAGLLAQLLSPAFSRVHQMMLKNQASLADRLAMLKNQMEGAEPPIQAANAAL